MVRPEHDLTSITRCEVFAIATTATPPGPNGHRPDRLKFLGHAKFAGLVALISAVIGLLAYVGDVQERRGNDGGTAGGTVATPSSAAPASGVSATPSTAAPSSGPAAGEPGRPARPGRRTTAPSDGAQGENPPATGVTRVFRLQAQRVDTRTVDVAVTPPSRVAADRTYWFFVEVDWRDGNTDYYPREKLTGGPQTLVVDIPPDATLDADRTGRAVPRSA
jgi:hypothetical protein